MASPLAADHPAAASRIAAWLNEAQGRLRAGMTQRAWWSVRYTDGRIVSEWERDWTHLPYKGRQAVRLYCPDGQVAELGNTQDSTGRLFQFKCAISAAGVGGGVTQHVIGRVDGTGGECVLYAWDYGARRLVGPLRDNVTGLRFGNVGPLAFEVLGLAQP